MKSEQCVFGNTLALGHHLCLTFSLSEQKVKTKAESCPTRMSTEALEGDTGLDVLAAVCSV